MTLLGTRWRLRDRAAEPEDVHPVAMIVQDRSAEGEVWFSWLVEGWTQTVVPVGPASANHGSRWPGLPMRHPQAGWLLVSPGMVFAKPTGEFFKAMERCTT